MATKKKISKKNLGTSFDRLLSYNLKDDGTIDDQMIELAEAILSDCPVLLNFDTVKDVNVCNRVLSFLSGLNYAIAGRVYQIGAESYLIASSDAFLDGSLEKWVKEFGHIDD